MTMKRVLGQWLGSTAGKVSVILIVISIILLGFAWSTLGVSSFTEHYVDVINSCLVGNVLFVHYNSIGKTK